MSVPGYHRSYSFFEVSAVANIYIMKTIWILVLVMLQCLNSVAQPGDTTVQRQAQQLEEVTVKAKDPIITQEGDRIIYNTEADPDSKVNSVLDIMRKVPHLSVDGNDNILLDGSSSFKVYLNGRLSGLITNNPKEVLRSMPASTIKSIEVITNPPARYDAEGLAGIINIVTARQRYDGYRGGVNIKERGPVDGPGAGGNFTFKHGLLGVHVIAGISIQRTPEAAGELRRTTNGEHPTQLYQQSTGTSKGYSVYPGMELSFHLDSLNLLSGEVSWGKSKSKEISTRAVAIVSEYPLQGYSVRGMEYEQGSGIETAINYQRGFKANKKQVMTFSYRYQDDGDDLHNDVLVSNKINFTAPDYRQHNAERYTEHTAQVDYVQPVGKVLAEGGLKTIFRTNESDYRYSVLDNLTGIYEPDLTRTGMFGYRQAVLAAYTCYSYNIGSWQLKAGARAEKTMIDGIYSEGMERIRNRYFNLLPNVYVFKKTGSKSSWSLSYTRRIQRPATAELNPFVDRSDPNFQSGGNPYLQPITSNVYQVSYLLSGKATLNVSFGGMFLNNIFNLLPYYDTATGVTVTTQQNYGKGRVLKNNISFTCPVSDKLNVAISSDVRHVSLQGVAFGNTIKNSGLDVYVNASGGYNMQYGWRINADVTFKKGGLLLPLGRMNGFVATSVSLNKDIVQSKLTLSAAVSNPFSKFRYADEMIKGPGFVQATHSEVYFRRFTVSLNYRFGMLKDGIKKTTRKIDNDDVVR